VISQRPIPQPPVYQRLIDTGGVQARPHVLGVGRSYVLVDSSDLDSSRLSLMEEEENANRKVTCVNCDQPLGYSRRHHSGDSMEFRLDKHALNFHQLDMNINRPEYAAYFAADIAFEAAEHMVYELTMSNVDDTSAQLYLRVLSPSMVMSTFSNVECDEVNSIFTGVLLLYATVQEGDASGVHETIQLPSDHYNTILALLKLNATWIPSSIRSVQHLSVSFLAYHYEQ